jgi:hypothetical protein
VLAGEDLAHRVSRQGFVQHCLNHGLDDLAVQVRGQIPGHRRDLLWVERVARRDVDAQRKAFHCLEGSPASADSVGPAINLVAPREAAHLMEAGNDQCGAVVHLDRTAGELVEADAHLAAADALHRRVDVKGVAGSGQHTECEKAEATMVQGAIEASRQGRYSGSRAPERMAKVLNDLGDLWFHEVSPQRLIFDGRGSSPAVGSGRSVRTPVRHGVHARRSAAEDSMPTRGLFVHAP